MNGQGDDTGASKESGVNRGQREHEGRFMGYPGQTVVLGEHRGSFREYFLKLPSLDADLC